MFNDRLLNSCLFLHQNGVDSHPHLAVFAKQAHLPLALLALMDGGDLGRFLFFFSSFEF